MTRRIPVLPTVAWLIFLVWLLAQLPTVVGLTARGQSPIDFLAYRLAADALERGESPYRPPEQSQQIWRSFHQAHVDLLAASARSQGQAALRELLDRPQQPGPYLYPPTLALLIAQLHLTALPFTSLLLLSVFGFGWLWLRWAGASSRWLLLIVGSWDVLASLNGGNVELVLLCLTLLAARLLWDDRGLLAAALIALVVLIKPFYVLGFVVIGLLHLARRPAARDDRLRALAATAGLSLALVALEVARWGAPLQAVTLDYLQHAWDYHWFVLPVAEQTPMSAWNRTPFQALMSAGLPLGPAQAAALALWLLVTAITVWRAWRVPVPFPLAFALAVVLLYWGRPVGWGLIYLECVLAAAVWPTLRRRQHLLLLGALLALMASHWSALVLTLQGQGLLLLTLQPADRPWETWLVLPLAWLVLVRALAVTGAADDRSPAPARAPFTRRAAAAPWK